MNTTTQHDPGLASLLRSFNAAQRAREARARSAVQPHDAHPRDPSLVLGDTRVAQPRPDQQGVHKPMAIHPNTGRSTTPTQAQAQPPLGLTLTLPLEPASRRNSDHEMKRSGSAAKGPKKPGSTTQGSLQIVRSLSGPSVGTPLTTTGPTPVSYLHRSSISGSSPGSAQSQQSQQKILHHEVRHPKVTLLDVAGRYEPITREYVHSTKELAAHARAIVLAAQSQSTSISNVRDKHSRPSPHSPSGQSPPVPPPQPLPSPLSVVANPFSHTSPCFQFQEQYTCGGRAKPAQTGEEVPILYSAFKFLFPRSNSSMTDDGPNRPTFAAAAITFPKWYSDCLKNEQTTTSPTEDGESRTPSTWQLLSDISKLVDTFKRMHQSRANQQRKEETTAEAGDEGNAVTPTRKREQQASERASSHHPSAKPQTKRVKLQPNLDEYPQLEDSAGDDFANQDEVMRDANNNDPAAWGHCDICRQSYRGSLNAHLKTAMHMAFVANQANYSALDEFAAAVSLRTALKWRQEEETKRKSFEAQKELDEHRQHEEEGKKAVKHERPQRRKEAVSRAQANRVQETALGAGTTGPADDQGGSIDKDASTVVAVTSVRRKTRRSVTNATEHPVEADPMGTEQKSMFQAEAESSQEAAVANAESGKASSHTEMHVKRAEAVEEPILPTLSTDANLFTTGTASTARRSLLCQIIDAAEQEDVTQAPPPTVLQLQGELTTRSIGTSTPQLTPQTFGSKKPEHTSSKGHVLGTISFSSPRLPRRSSLARLPSPATIHSSNRSSTSSPSTTPSQQLAVFPTSTAQQSSRTTRSSQGSPSDDSPLISAKSSQQLASVLPMALAEPTPVDLAEMLPTSRFEQRDSATEQLLVQASHSHAAHNPDTSSSPLVSPTASDQDDSLPIASEIPAPTATASAVASSSPAPASPTSTARISHTNETQRGAVASASKNFNLAPLIDQLAFGKDSQAALRFPNLRAHILGVISPRKKHSPRSSPKAAQKLNSPMKYETPITKPQTKLDLANPIQQSDVKPTVNWQLQQSHGEPQSSSTRHTSVQQSSVQQHNAMLRSGFQSHTLLPSPLNPDNAFDDPSGTSMNSLWSSSENISSLLSTNAANLASLVSTESSDAPVVATPTTVVTRRKRSGVKTPDPPVVEATDEFEFDAVHATDSPASSTSSSVRRRGRPKGAKNKPNPPDWVPPRLRKQDSPMSSASASAASMPSTSAEALAK